jgi:hypothetical protein
MRRLCPFRLGSSNCFINSLIQDVTSICVSGRLPFACCHAKRWSFGRGALMHRWLSSHVTGSVRWGMGVHCVSSPDGEHLVAGR